MLCRITQSSDAYRTESEGLGIDVPGCPRAKPLGSSPHKLEANVHEDSPETHDKI